MNNTQETTAFSENLEKLCCIIEESFHIGGLTISDQSAMCDFPAYEGAIEKVSTAVGFTVEYTNFLVHIAKRMSDVPEQKQHQSQHQ